MSTYTTRPVRAISNTAFKSMLADLSLVISPHALDHLSLNQRKIFKENELIDMITKENSRKIYVQANDRYAAYYRKKDGFRKIIISFEKNRAVIVTFMDTDIIPRLIR